MKQYSATEYGLVGDGKTLNRNALQKLIDVVHADGGGEIVFSGGDFVLATVYLKDGVKLRIDKSAKISGAMSFYDYDPEEKYDYPLYQDSSHSNFHCSLFVAENCRDVAITGGGTIDMRSVWDEDDVRGIKHRGPKCIALKSCRNAEISGVTIVNATDLAVYFTDCENVDIHGLKMRVYIDGVSPDNSRNVEIYDCDIEAGDDAIVFKSSYNLNKLGACENIRVRNCDLKSRCNAVKFGTETNGGFKNIEISDVKIRETRFAGIAVESVDGAKIDGIRFSDIDMKNVGTPFFVHLGKRLRGPAGTAIGEIKNVTFENIKADGPYEPYEAVAWNYNSFKANDNVQKPWSLGMGEGFDDGKKNLADEPWQITSNVCGLENHLLKNITFRNVELKLSGGAKEYTREVPETAQSYPEVYVYGRVLPAKGIYFRHTENLTLENVTVKTYRPDTRADFVFDDVSLALTRVHSGNPKQHKSCIRNE